MKNLVMTALVAVAAMVGVSHVANADALDDIKKSGKIRIAIDLGVPPYGMTDDQMQPTGLDVEAARDARQGLGPARSSTSRPPAPRASPRCRPARPIS